MKCELCHQADAELAVRRTVEGEERELYVCRACARGGSVHEERAASSDASSGASSGEAVSAFPLMGMILDAAFEIVGRASEPPEPKCAVCGITRSEYRKASRLGCPACYEAFAQELDAAVQEMHRSLQHTGKVPERARAQCERQRLEQALEEAVKAQRYEEAIALRDRIRRLGSDGGQGGPA